MNSNFKIKNWIDYQKMIDNEYLLSKKSSMNIEETYIYKLQQQLEEKDKVIKEKNKCLLEIAKETIEMVNWLKLKGMNFDNESWVNELEEILERGKNEI